jgi:hypothetical protein
MGHRCSPLVRSFNRVDALTVTLCHPHPRDNGKQEGGNEREVTARGHPFLCCENHFSSKLTLRYFSLSFVC